MQEKTRPEFNSRQEIPAPYRWRLEDIFKTDQAWEQALKAVLPLLDAVERLRGRLSEGPDMLAQALQEADQLDLELMELYAYARMRRDEDNSNNLYQDMADRVTSLYYQS